MKNILLLASLASLFAVNQASAQETIGVVDVVEDAVVADLQAPCGDRYYSTKTQNWFIDLGAGIDVPFVENPSGRDRQITANYGAAFGKWFSPYFGWRLGADFGSRHWNVGATDMASFRAVNGNIDIMWDMFNSLGGVNSKRVFSIVPFVSAGMSYSWNHKPAAAGNVSWRNREVIPMVSAGLQMRFRLCSYVNFFVQARLGAMGDAYNNLNQGKSIDLDVTTQAGFTFKLGGDSFNRFNACDYSAYINGLNNQVNALRGELATTAAALAVAQAQLPCPEVVERVVAVESVSAPLLSTVRFSLNSAKISPMEKVNVYNVAQWMQANPDQNVVITGYADKDTGTASYNKGLSERRAKAVYNMLVNDYGISPSRLAMVGEGSAVQPYDVNNWNRIVIFQVAE